MLHHNSHHCELFWNRELFILLCELLFVDKLVLIYVINVYSIFLPEGHLIVLIDTILLCSEKATGKGLNQKQSGHECSSPDNKT